jgi:hypothetical protein
VDGAEWAEVAAPEGVAASSLAASGDTLYAVGTSPGGGGGRDLVLAASRDGAATWSTVTMPDGIAALDAAHPGQLQMSGPVVASLNATNVVVSVTVTAAPDLSTVPEAGGDIRWEYTETGVTTYAIGACPNEDGRPLCPGEGSEAAGGDRTGDGTTDVDELAANGTGEVLGTYSWDELGISPELREYAKGKTLLYASEDGQNFKRVELPVEPTATGPAVNTADGYSRGPLIATADGYRLFLGGSSDANWNSTLVLRSRDGRAWERAGSLVGFPLSAGVLGGRAAVAVHGAAERGADVQVEQPDGTWASLGLDQAIADDGSIDQVTFGPMGLAALVRTDHDDGSPVVGLLHSADGSTVSVVGTDELVDASAVQGVSLSVGADAITVRLTDAGDGDPATVPEQRVLVGTPRG